MPSIQQYIAEIKQETSRIKKEYRLATNDLYFKDGYLFYGDYRFMIDDYRNYQDNIVQLFRKKEFLYYWLVWHRRAGKDLVAFDILREIALTTIGRYAYILPTMVEAKRVFWNGGYGTSRGYKKNRESIPKDLKTIENSSDMIIELENGSLIECLGANYPDRARGPAYAGAIFSEFHFAECGDIMDVITPSIIESGGFMFVISTFDGKNWAYYRFLEVQGAEDWFTQILTVNDTLDENGEPYTTEEMIQAARDTGMSEGKVNQEYYCMPLADAERFYFADELNALEEANRFIVDLPIFSHNKVYVSFDLGRDMTAMIIFQIHNNQIRILRYKRSNKTLINVFADDMRRLELLDGIKIEKIFLPPDVVKKSIVTSISARDILDERCFVTELLPPENIKDSIDNARMVMQGDIWFDKEKCSLLIQDLSSYEKIYDADNGIYKDRPRHNIASHGSDAFRYLCQAISIGRTNTQTKIAANIASWQHEVIIHQDPYQ